MRECGECTLCCSLLGVHALEKPPLTDCKYCNIGKGCKIYKTRPNECADFNCLWIIEEKVPDSLKPSISHVVLSDLQEDIKQTGLEIKNKTVIVYVDPLYPNAYKQDEMRDFLNMLLANGIVLIVIENGKKHMLQWGKVEDELAEKAV